MIITLASSKGGADKTTSAIYLAAAWAHRMDRPALVLDADPQSNASDWRDLAEEAGEDWSKQLAAVPIIRGLGLRDLYMPAAGVSFAGRFVGFGLLRGLGFRRTGRRVGRWLVGRFALRRLGGRSRCVRQCDGRDAYAQCDDTCHQRDARHDRGLAVAWLRMGCGLPW